MEKAVDAENHRIMAKKQKVKKERMKRKAATKRQKDTLSEGKAVTENKLLPATIPFHSITLPPPPTQKYIRLVQSA